MNTVKHTGIMTQQDNDNMNYMSCDNSNFTDTHYAVALVLWTLV